MNKTYILLRLYDDLREGKNLKISRCCGEFHISVSTFRRYVAFLRGYLNERYGQEIVYSTQLCEYFLKNK